MDSLNLQLRCGVDQLAGLAASWKNKRLAMVTNDAAITNNGTPSRLALLKSGYNILKLFSPEHGINAMGTDGAFQKNGFDALTGLPVTSLYGNKLAPDDEDLKDIDIVLFDIPDIGCRFYTYLWTMTAVMEACALSRKALIILDRPNPIGGLLSKAEGPMLHPSCASFIGRWNIPLKHACTLGELALYLTAARALSLELTVIPVQHYRRSFTALHDFNFIRTSPAISTVDAAFFYPGSGLLEGININEGRGTATPFMVFGAPWLAAADVLDLLMPTARGFTAAVTSYVPASGLYAGEVCSGVVFKLGQPSAFMAVQNGITILQSLFSVHTIQVQERLYPTVANPGGKGHLDKLLGIPNVLQQIKQGHKISTALDDGWQEAMSNYLLY